VGRVDARKETVRAGYDALAERYASWSRSVEGDPRERFLDAFVALLGEKARVLDLGCGPGVPSTRRLAEQFEVLGVDLSETQLALARAAVPGATFVCDDFASLDLPDGSFAGITALYSITHVPREEHAALFRKIARWLTDDGIFLATFSVGGTEDWHGDFIGVPMFFSCFDADTSKELLRAAGFELLVDEVVEQHEPGEGVGRFLWVLARRPPVG
jgi:ubiquinone/menaquinone biosynthesis C-methylase UbiE